MRFTTLLIAGLLAGGSVAGARAQTTPAQPTTRPAAKPAATRPAAGTAGTAATAAPAGRTVGSGSGPILTREELRSCMNQEQTVRGRIADSEARRAALNKDKDALTAEQETLRGERPGADAAAQAEALRNRMKEYGDRTAAWKTKAAQFTEANRSGSSADRERKDIERERDALNKEQQQIEADRERINAAIGQAATDYNAKVSAQEARVNDWNQRNRQLNDDARALEDERQTWLAACKDRRYREDDETAIRNGK